LKAGEKLPSHRELSERIVVAPLTVKKAYDELEALGFLETQRGRGTFVCATLPKIDREDQLERIRQDGRNFFRRLTLPASVSPSWWISSEAPTGTDGGARDEKERV